MRPPIAAWCWLPVTERFNLTAQEISQFGRLGLRPVIFVLNNSGYLIERLLCKDPAIAYNDIAAWRIYRNCREPSVARAGLPPAPPLAASLTRLWTRPANAPSASFIEVVTDPYAASPLALKMHESFRRLYKS